VWRNHVPAERLDKAYENVKKAAEDLKESYNSSRESIETKVAELKKAIQGAHKEAKAIVSVCLTCF
jgi:predicted  nucleic acid-binding Zn-ribbon protein